MSTDVFELHIQQSLEKLENLWQRSNNLPTPDSELWQNTKELPQQQQKLLQESLEELSASIEELRLAAETLREQNTQLLADRQQISAEREYYRNLFNSAADCYLIANQDGTIAEINEKAVELLGVSPQYLIGKPLAVFIALNCRQEYYTNLNQIKRGKVAEANWKLEIITRQKRRITVECLVVAVRDRSGKIVNLRWRICPVNADLNRNDMINSTPILIESLRYPLYDLVTQIDEIQAKERANRRETDCHWQEIGNQVSTLKDRVNDAYILHNLKGVKDLNLSLVDYGTFFHNLIRQFKKKFNYKQIISLEELGSNVGICDVLLLQQIAINLLNKSIEYTTINDEIKVRLTKDSAEYLSFQIDLLTEANTTEIIKKFEPLVNKERANSISPQNLSLSAIEKCVYLLNGTINLDCDNTRATIRVKFPLVSTIG